MSASSGADGFVTVQVTDSGCGIPAEHLDVIWTHLHQIDMPACSNQAARRHGAGSCAGQCTLASKPGASFRPMGACQRMCERVSLESERAAMLAVSSRMTLSDTRGMSRCGGTQAPVTVTVTPLWRKFRLGLVSMM